MPDPPPTAPSSPDARDFDPQRLVAERGRKVRLVGRAAMVLALEKAVLEAISSRLGVADEELAEEVVADARAAFFRSLAGRGRTARSFTESGLQQMLAEARQHFESSRTEVRDELAEMEQLLDEQRERADAARRRLEAELERSLDPERNALAVEMRRRFEGAGLTEAAHQALCEELIALVLAELERVQAQVLELKMARHEQELETARRRIAKLTATLLATEENLRRLAESKGFDPGLASIYREVQGLAEEETFAELKREMLAKIFEANLKLREQRGADRQSD